MSRSGFLWLLAGTSAVTALWYVIVGRHWLRRIYDGGRASIEQRMAQYGARADARLRPAFAGAGLPYPPAEVALLAFKDVRGMAVYGRAPAAAPWRYVKRYRVLGASGRPGPKLMEGDRQVPEGVYQVALLNPNSRFHLSLRLNYPNAFDRRMGAADGRANLGSDIMIHGGSSSIGCLAMGDDAAEDLFVLAARVSPERVRVVIAPTDFRVEPARLIMYEPRWVSMLYASLSEELKQFHRSG
ncbi:MAG: hypothetical protein ABL891_23805 [Burkholderiales bacterium]